MQVYKAGIEHRDSFQGGDPLSPPAWQSRHTGVWSEGRHGYQADTQIPKNTNKKYANTQMYNSKELTEKQTRGDRDARQTHKYTKLHMSKYSVDTDGVGHGCQANTQKRKYIKVAD